MTARPAEQAAGAPALEHRAAAVAVFGGSFDQAVRYAELLGSEGVARGLIGPREFDRLWDRHLLNCAVIGEHIAAGAFVADIGSGAGLPGIALALARPDLRVELVEPMQRRIDFLRTVVAELGLGRVTVSRSRAEDAGRARYDVVVARAVAPLERLAPMTLPLVKPGGVLLAMKGAGAAGELAAAGRAIATSGGEQTEVIQAGVGLVDPATVLVRITRAARGQRHTHRSAVARSEGRDG